MIFINNKSLLDLDVLIDDGLHNFEGFKGASIIFDRPWNRIFPKRALCDYIIYGWDEKILDIIKKKSNGKGR